MFMKDKQHFMISNKRMTDIAENIYLAQEEYEPEIHFGKEQDVELLVEDIRVMQESESFLKYPDGVILSFMNSRFDRLNKSFQGVIKYQDKHPEYSVAYYDMHFDDNLTTIKGGTVKYFRKDFDSMTIFENKDTLELT